MAQDEVDVQHEVQVDEHEEEEEDDDEQVEPKAISA